MESMLQKKSGTGIPKAGKRAPGGGRKPDGDEPKLKVTVTLPPQLVADLKNVAAGHDTTFTALVEKALRQTYFNEGKEP